ncbi:hypothetical protein GGR56DRAFT_663633 [Xylariaceae sp. FL0804]|nr:hypothetical protein GGR56DRAFT_663633 [Xylariaceae sp. FL0804]
MMGSEGVPTKSRRVRTGCLTCRERHLKCDEAMPDCRNCRKSNRECKRGVRLNFIDMTCKKPPYIPPTAEWAVQFQDESRLIASEYHGGLGRYTKFDTQVVTLPQESHIEANFRRRSQAIETMKQQTEADQRSAAMLQTPQSICYNDQRTTNTDYTADAQSYSRGCGAASYMAPLGPSASVGHPNLLSDASVSIKEEDGGSITNHVYNNGDVPTTAPMAADTGVSPTSSIPGVSGISQSYAPNSGTGIITPPNDGGGEREYLNSPEEMRFMQVFVTEVGVWMDSLDKEKHFSRLVPYHALKCPMLLNALLACGVKQITLTQQYSDDKALFYYDTATTQLLRSLRNPDRNTAECAATAVVLNVYEIMSEKPAQRMSHIAGARALIRECGWNAKSEGLGAACFWLNVGMELLSCLAFNWQTAWDPDQWGVDMDFATERESGSEEIWVHRIFYVVAKIANFRASVPRFQEPSPLDEQARLLARLAEWTRLKAMCDEWNDACPRSMHPLGLLYPSQAGAAKSLFPNIWIIKRAAVVGQLYYHTAQCILAQVNPTEPRSAPGARRAALHHARQVCGIVAHAEDRGVASVSIRSLAIVAEVLADGAEQREVAATLERIDRETGWKLAGVVAGLKRTWGWGGAAAAGDGRKKSILGGGVGQQQQTSTNPTPLAAAAAMPVTSTPAPTLPLAAPRPIRVNPLSFADFSLPNHPYREWYEPPNRSSAYHHHSEGGSL